MNALTIIGIVAGIILFLVIGYFLWFVGMEKYGFNIFSIGVLIRGVISYIALFLALGASKKPDDFIVYLCLAAVLTLKESNLIIH